MQIRLYLDEDAMAHSLTRELRARGVDVATAISEGLLGNADSVQLEFATSQERVIYTYNVSDYARLHAKYLVEGKRHTGIILVHQSRFTLGEQIRRTLRLVTTLSAKEMHGRVEYLSSWG